MHFVSNTLFAIRFNSATIVAGSSTGKKPGKFLAAAGERKAVAAAVWILFWLSRS